MAVLYLLLWIALCSFLSSYVLSPILVRRNARFQCESPIVSFDLETAPSVVRVFVSGVAQRLDHLGFEPIAHLHDAEATPNTSQFVAYFRSPTGDEAHATATFTRMGASRVIPSFTVSFQRNLGEGRELYVLNAEHVPDLPKPLYRESYHFPGLGDLNTLHGAFIHLADRVGDPVVLDSVLPEDLYRQPLVRELDSWVESGHSWFDESTRSYRLTWKGAIRLAMSLLPPFKQIRQRASFARARNVLLGLGLPPDYQRVSYMHELAKESPNWQREILSANAAETLPTGAGAVELDQEWRIASDFTCVECGYNVRGVGISNPCPECGTPLGESRYGRMLSLCPIDWLKTIASGASMVVWGMVSFGLALLALSLKLALPQFFRVPDLLVFGALVVSLMVGFYGIVRVTQRNLLDPSRWSAGRIAGWSLTGGGILFIGGVALAEWGPGTLYLALDVVAGLFLFVLPPILVLLHLRVLALRAPDTRLASWTLAFIWTFAVWVSLSGLVIGLGYSMSRLGTAAALGPPTVVPATGPAAALTQVSGSSPMSNPVPTAGVAVLALSSGVEGAVVCWLFGAPALFALGFGLLCRRYRMVFRDALKQAEAWRCVASSAPVSAAVPSARPAERIPVHPPIAPPTSPQRTTPPTHPPASMG